MFTFDELMKSVPGVTADQIREWRGRDYIGNGNHTGTAETFSYTIEDLRVVNALYYISLVFSTLPSTANSIRSIILAARRGEHQVFVHSVIISWPVAYM